MKKVLTIAVVALLATATLFAGVSFSGRFRQGYTFTFADGQDAAIKPWKTEEAKLVLKVSDDNGIWTVNVKGSGNNNGVTLDSNDKWSANATFNLTNALAAGGIDTGDFSLAVSLGANSKMTALSAYNDVTGNEYYKLKNNGSESMQLAMAYGKLAQFNVAFDPTTTDNGSIVLSAKSEPINGVAVAAAYSYNGYITDGTMSNIVFEENGSSFSPNLKELVADNVIGFSADVNVAKLVGLDFNLGVSAYDNISFQKEKTNNVETSFTYNSFAAAVYGGIDVVDGFVELTMGNASVKANDIKYSDSTFGLNMQVNLNLVENLGLDVYYNIANLEKAGDTFAIGGDVSYNLAGVELALNAEYAEKAFSLTPKMIIVF